jgi:TatD DNase family protein
MNGGKDIPVFRIIMNPFINIHTHLPDHRDSNIHILNAIPTGIVTGNEYFSYGIHPWDIGKMDVEAHIKILEKLCRERKLLAIGEIGMDRAIERPLEIQKDVFIRQLEIASQYQLPVILHCVRAWGDILQVRKAGKFSNHWIFHGFNGNLQTANQIIASACSLSFGKALIQSMKLQSVFVHVPKEIVFFETDDSNLKIEEIYQKAAELSNICIDDLKAVIFKNYNKIFMK